MQSLWCLHHKPEECAQMPNDRRTGPAAIPDEQCENSGCQKPAALALLGD
ncbi:hypothetical protein BH10CYA1_BH10CYA1_64210 [soil metagenome]